MIRICLLSLAVLLESGCAVDPTSGAYIKPYVAYNSGSPAPADNSGDARPRFGNPLENAYGLDDGVDDAADGYYDDTADYEAFPADYGVAWPTDDYAYDPFFAPYWVNAIFAPSSFESYFNWVQWYGHHRRLAACYPARRDDRARDEAVMLAFLQGSGRGSDAPGGRLNESGATAGFALRARMPTQAPATVSSDSRTSLAAPTTRGLRSNAYAASRRSEAVTRALPSPEDYWVATMPGSRSPAGRASSARDLRDNPDQSALENSHNSAYRPVDQSQGSGIVMPRSRVPARETGPASVDRGNALQAVPAAASREYVARERANLSAAPMPASRPGADPSTRLGNSPSSQSEVHEAHDFDRARHDH